MPFPPRGFGCPVTAACVGPSVPSVASVPLREGSLALPLTHSVPVGARAQQVLQCLPQALCCDLNVSGESAPPGADLSWLRAPCCVFKDISPISQTAVRAKVKRRHAPVRLLSVPQAAISRLPSIHTPGISQVTASHSSRLSIPVFNKMHKESSEVLPCRLTTRVTSEQQLR